MNNVVISDAPTGYEILNGTYEYQGYESFTHLWYHETEGATCTLTDDDMVGGMLSWNSDPFNMPPQFYTSSHAPESGTWTGWVDVYEVGGVPTLTVDAGGTVEEGTASIAQDTAASATTVLQRSGAGTVVQASAVTATGTEIPAHRTLTVQSKEQLKTNNNWNATIANTIAFSPSPDALGVTTPQATAFTFSPEIGAEVTLTAPETDPEGYYWYGWYTGALPGTDGVATRDKAYTFTPGGNLILTAAYKARAGIEQEESDVAASIDDATHDTTDADWLTSGGTDRRSWEFLYLNHATLPFATLIRFQCNAPRGATITSATLSLHDFSTGVDDPNLTVYCEDIDDSPSAADGNAFPEDRVRTTASLSWVASNKVNWQALNVAALVQEVVDRPGWVAGNYVGFLIIGNTGGAAYAVVSYDYPELGLGVMGPKFAADWVPATLAEGGAEGATAASGAGVRETLGVATPTAETSADGAGVLLASAEVEAVGETDADGAGVVIAAGVVYTGEASPIAETAAEGQGIAIRSGSATATGTGAVSGLGVAVRTALAALVARTAASGAGTVLQDLWQGAVQAMRASKRFAADDMTASTTPQTMTATALPDMDAASQRREE